MGCSVVVRDGGGVALPRWEWGGGEDDLPIVCLHSLLGPVHLELPNLRCVVEGLHQ